MRLSTDGNRCRFWTSKAAVWLDIMWKQVHDRWEGQRCADVDVLYFLQTVRCISLVETYQPYNEDWQSPAAPEMSNPPNYWLKNSCKPNILPPSNVTL